jgi:hypothetical protein
VIDELLTATSQNNDYSYHAKGAGGEPYKLSVEAIKKLPKTVFLHINQNWIN